MTHCNDQITALVSLISVIVRNPAGSYEPGWLSWSANPGSAQDRSTRAESVQALARRSE